MRITTPAYIPNHSSGPASSSPTQNRQIESRNLPATQPSPIKSDPQQGSKIIDSEYVEIYSPSTILRNPQQATHDSTQAAAGTDAEQKLTPTTGSAVQHYRKGAETGPPIPRGSLIDIIA